MTKRGLAVALLAFLPIVASAAVSVTVVETDPVSPATLGHWGRFDLRVAYETDRPMRVRGDAFREGQRVTSITSGAPRCDPGTGEVLFWLAFTEAQAVDRVVVWAEDEATRASLAEAPLEVDLTWTGEKGGTAAPRSPWAQRLQDAQDRKIYEQASQQGEGPFACLGTLLVMAAMAAVPLYCVVQPLLLVVLRGGWRWAAAVPLVPMAAVVVHAVFAFAAGSNIFPLFVIFMAPPAVVYLAVVAFLARRAGALGREKKAPPR
jgi:hypothetical protein